MQSALDMHVDKQVMRCQVMATAGVRDIRCRSGADSRPGLADTLLDSVPGHPGTRCLFHDWQGWRSQDLENDAEDATLHVQVFLPLTVIGMAICKCASPFELSFLIHAIEEECF